jgi:hypothetical protein
MPLSPAVVKELTAEFETLVRRRQDLEERMNAIQLLLRRVTGARRLQTIPEVQMTITDRPGSGGGLRDAIRSALEHGPLAPGQVIHVLKDRNFTMGGKTPFDTRVYNELGRMKKDGLVKRNASGGYALANSGGA